MPRKKSVPKRNPSTVEDDPVSPANASPQTTENVSNEGSSTRQRRRQKKSSEEATNYTTLSAGLEGANSSLMQTASAQSSKVSTKPSRRTGSRKSLTASTTEPDHSVTPGLSSPADGNQLNHSRRVKRTPKHLIDDSEKVAEAVSGDSVTEIHLASPILITPVIKRGRSRKKPDADSLALVLDEEFQEKVPDIKMATPILITPIRKKGRPRKSTPNPVSSGAIDTPPSTTCVHCEQEFSDLKSLKDHLLLQHHREWSHQLPEGEYSPKTVFKRHKSIKCLQCSKSFKFLSYFQIHLKWCGREEEREVCPVCNRELKAMWMKQHMYSHKPDKAKSTKSISSRDACEANARSKKQRKAAQKALNHMKEFDEEMQEDNQSFMACEYNKVNDQTLEQACTVLDPVSHMSCPYTGCDFTCRGRKSQMVQHLQSCSHNPQPVVLQGYQCILCGKKFPRITPMRHHMENHRKQQQDDTVGSESDYNPEDVSSPEEDNDNHSGEENGSEQEVNVFKVVRKEDKVTEWPYYWEAVFRYTARRNILARAENWFNDLHAQLPADIFSDWLPLLSQYQKPTCSISELYGHGEKLAVKLVGDTKHGRNTVHQIGVGETCFQEGCQVINVGGSVWGLAFCPLNPRSSDEFQYLAVSVRDRGSAETVPSNDDQTPESRSEAGHAKATLDPPSSTIQLWRCLGVSMDNTELVYSIRVETGEVWDICWCPAGAWPSDAQQSDSECSRLGLLAAACGDGCIHLYSMPHPSSVSIEMRQPVFHLQPTQSLAMCPHPHLLNPCLCMDWSWGDQCGSILAGFSDGCVGLWKLRNRACVLQQTSSYLLPCKAFQAHLGSVTTVAFSPDTSWLAATGGQDRNIRVWDLRDSVQPLEEGIRSRVTKIVWKPSSDIICGAYDNCFAYEHSGVIQTCLGVDSRHRLTTNHASTVWGLSFSMWANQLISCDSQGSVKGLSYPSHGGPIPDSKHTKLRHNIMTVSVESKDDMDQDSNHLFVIRLQPQKISSSLGVNITLQDSLRSLHRVVWNQNVNQHSWLACGGRAGLVFLIKNTT